MFDIEGYSDAVLSALQRLGAGGVADRDDTYQAISHGFMKGRDPVKIADAIARRYAAETPVARVG